MGVVLNRPSEVVVSDLLPGWSELATPPPVVFAGGPVMREAVIGVGHISGAERPLQWQEIAEEIGVVELAGDPALASASLSGLRIFAGYAGWGPEQLESEVEQGSWMVVEAQPSEDVFDADPASLWKRVLRRQGRLYANFPTDPSRN